VRVLAITGNASLVVALGSMMRDWEVVTVRTVEEATEAASDSAVALIDQGDSDRGLEIADQLYRSGITIPSVVIVDRSVDGGRASVLMRPFSLEDLSVAVRAASERVSTPEPAHAVKTLPTRGPSTAAPEPERPSPKRRASLTVVPPAPEPPVSTASERVEPESEAPEPVLESPAVEPDPLEVEEPPAEPFDEPEELSEPEDEPESWDPEPEIEPEPEVVAVSPLDGRLTPHVPAQPQPAPVPAAAAPQAAVAVAAAQRAAQSEPQGRWRLRRKPARAEKNDESAEPPLVRRLRRAAANLRDVEGLVEELPVLDDLRTLADALIGEIDAQFTAPVASVFTRGQDGYQAIAHRGLSRVEAGMVVADTQPLFSDVLRTGEGILIQPVDLAQGLVAGIGGARTEALMAAPALLNDECVAIVLVGGDRFDEADLDRLSDLAGEAAPGLAVAHSLQRLRGGGE